MSKHNKPKKWIRKRHGIIVKIAKVFLYPFVKLKYHAKIEKCKDKRQCIILANHQTAFDQFFIAYAYNQPIYYLASEDIFSNGFISKLLRFAVNPIPIKKQTNDVRAVMNCLRVAKEGGSIGIFPEGNRTFSGTTEHISIAIVKLVKALKLPLSFFRIEGGYGVQPRWSDKVRKGKIRAYTSKTLEPNDYLNLTDQELYDLIKQELYVDEREIKENYKSKKRAEYLERTVYVCPSCGIANFKSRKNKTKCLSCGKEIEYGVDKSLKGVGFNFEFKFVKEWYDYQVKYINSITPTDYIDKEYFKDQVSLYSVKEYKNKELIAKKTELIAFGDRFEFYNLSLGFKDVSAVTVLGRNKLNIYYQDNIYQFKGQKSFNAIKYVNVFYRWRGFIKGENNEQFLGL